MVRQFEIFSPKLPDKPAAFCKESLMLFRSLRYALLAAFAGMMLVVFTGAAPAKANCDRNIGCYGALSAGLWRDNNGAAHVRSAAVWNYPDIVSAGNAAIEQCGNRGYNCKIVGTFSKGNCGFISVGNTRNGVSWGTSATPQEAMNQCAKGIYNCRIPQGGCTAAPN
jgi:hypothetical protein